MKPIHCLMLRILFPLAVFCMAGIARAGDDKPPVKLTLHPAAEPRPALKYQLLPEFMDRVPGNAAVYYGKVTAEQIQFFSNQELLGNIERWRKASLEELRGEEVRLPPLGSIDYFLDRAARCDYCDWQLPIREGEFYTMLLPDVQQTRQFARILGTKARIHTARGEFDEAVKTFQTGYALGQDAAEGETLVNGLVGISICGIISKQVTEFVQQPDAPNLYWGLTKLPRPLVDVREAVEAEMNAVELSFPELRDLEAAKGSSDQWRERLSAFWQKLAQWSNDSSMKLMSNPAMVTAASVRGYPTAKRALIEREFPPESVETMPVGKVILLYTMLTYKDLRDDIFKWFFVPFPVAREGMEAAENEIWRASVEKREILPVANVFLPAILSCRRAVVRNERDIAVLRVIEALRIYAAGHEGQLPVKLTDVTEVPVPPDPVTGEPFIYRLEGDTAYLQGAPLPGVSLNYEITMAGE